MTTTMTKKISLYIGLLLCCSTHAVGQTDTNATKDTVAATATPDTTVLFNTPSARHTAIENFDYAIVLPNTGYKQTALSLSHFENEVDQASIVIYQYRQEFSEPQPVGDHSFYNINGVDATLYKQVEKDQCKQTLILNTKVPMTLTATCKSTDTTNINKLERSLLSIVYNGPAQKDKNVYTTSLFSINNGGYKLENAGLQLSIFTKSGDFLKERNENNKNYFQLVTFKSDVKKKQKKEAAKLIDGVLEKNSKVVKSSKCDINGKKGFAYDIVTTDDDNKTIETSYAVVIYTSNRVYLYYASANENMQENIATYKKIAQTLKIK